MNNIIIVAVLAVIVIAAGAYYLTSTGNPSGAQTTVPQGYSSTTAAISGSQLTYKNPKFASTAQYPQGWNYTLLANTNQSLVVAFAPNGGGLTQVRLTVLKAVNASFKTLAGTLFNFTLSLALNKNNSKSITVVSVQNTTVSGYKAINVVDQTLGFKSLYVFINATATVPDYYIFTYIATSSQNYTTYLPQAQQIISSFKIG